MLCSNWIWSFLLVWLQVHKKCYISRFCHFSYHHYVTRLQGKTKGGYIWITITRAKHGTGKNEVNNYIFTFRRIGSNIAKQNGILCFYEGWLDLKHRKQITTAGHTVTYIHTYAHVCASDDNRKLLVWFWFISFHDVQIPVSYRIISCHRKIIIIIINY